MRKQPRNILAGLRLLVQIALVLAVGAPKEAQAADKTKSRIEELFIWRVSDALGLKPDIEAKFAAEFKRLSEKKSKLSNDIESLVEQMDKTKDSSKTASLLKEYHQKISDHGRIQTEEMDSFEKLLGSKKFAEYLVLKRDLSQKLKDFVASPSTNNSQSPSKSESGSSKKLSDPKIIQDESN